MFSQKFLCYFKWRPLIIVRSIIAIPSTVTTFFMRAVSLATYSRCNKFFFPKSLIKMLIFQSIKKENVSDLVFLVAFACILLQRA